MAASHFSGPVVSENGFQNGAGSTAVVAAATTLTAADSGITQYLNAAGGAAITLPAPVAGMKFKFITQAAFATTDWTIVTAAGANIIEGAIYETTNLIVVASNEDTITLAAGFESVGDWIELESDGTSWFASGLFMLAGACAFTAT